MENKSKKKRIIDPACIHMPTASNTVIIAVHKRGKVFNAGFTIGNQYFTVAERGTIEEAQWTCDMLEAAFKTLITPKSLDKFKSDKVKNLMMNLFNPPITITNLR